MNYSMLHIEQIIGATLLRAPQVASDIQQVVFDSRRVDFPEVSIFFAFESSRHDGHEFIHELYQKGVRHFVVSKKLDSTLYPLANFLWVSDTLEALQKLALHHRQQFQLPVIGISGSNGKTIIKEWLFLLLDVDYTIVRSPRSFNSQIGVPLSVLQIESQHDLGVFEAGISKLGEMKKLGPIIDCSIGIFTNIGQAHAEGFKNKLEKAGEKAHLFENCQQLIYCKDHTIIREALSRFKTKKHSTWSRQQNADLQILSEETTSNGSRQITAIYQGKNIKIEIPFSDPASVENAIHCWLALLTLDIDPVVINKRMARLNTIPMRLELKAGINQSTLINDSYSSDLTSLSIALNFLSQQSGQLSKTLFLSDILQTGKAPAILYQEVAQLLEKKGISKLIGIGKEVTNIKQFCTIPQQFFYLTTKDFLSQHDLKNFQQEIILLKGAREFEFEKIAQRLAQKSHNTRLEINLSALTENLNTFRQLLQPETKLMVMIKAAAYGSGSDEIGRLLQFQKVDYLAVAYADEGVNLRKAGIQVPIMVLNPEKATFDTLVRYNLEPEIYSLNLLKQFLDFLSSNQAATIHLKIDTGMHRLGFEAKDLESLTEILIAHPRLRVGSIFSHLAASDEAHHDDFTEQQVHLFQQIYQQISRHLDYQPIQHILNSSGIIRFPQYQLDMVRLGIGMYGIDVNNSLENRLQPVLSLKASISQIKDIAVGETIGYSRKGKAETKMRTATISIGYADGLLRSAGNGNYAVLIHGKKAPIVGNVCMDMTIVDISEIPEAIEGDEVIIFGAEHPVAGLAKCYNSLIYEVFTGISERVKRVYFQES